jgi:hypothetical protein
MDQVNAVMHSRRGLGQVGSVIFNRPPVGLVIFNQPPQDMAAHLMAPIVNPRTSWRETIRLKMITGSTIMVPVAMI